MIIGYARVSTTEQNIRLDQDDLKPAIDASVDSTDARKKASLTDPYVISTRLRIGSICRNRSAGLFTANPFSLSTRV